MPNRTEEEEVESPEDVGGPEEEELGEDEEMVDLSEVLEEIDQHFEMTELRLEALSKADAALEKAIYFGIRGLVIMVEDLMIVTSPLPSDLSKEEEEALIDNRARARKRLRETLEIMKKPF